MAMKTFAAIQIGSAETEMRIYEISDRKGMREIDCINTRLNLGEDAYTERELDPEKIRELCVVLKEFKSTMEGYKVDGYRMCATSALREIRSGLITKDFIEKQTGLKLQIITNAEQRFLDYKSIASESASFEEIIKKGTAIADIGGNSTQISVFDKDKLITTQNIRMGKISTGEHYMTASKNRRHYASIVQELMEHELDGFGRLYQKKRQILNLILVDVELLDLLRNGYEDITGQKQPHGSSVYQVSAQQFRKLFEQMMEMSIDEIAKKYSLSQEGAEMALHSMLLSVCLLERMEAAMIWIMDVSLCDGLCYDYGVSEKLIRPRHNFDEDILASARSIAKRYKSNQDHVRHTEELCIEIFNKMRKIHGLTNRERLLLQICAILHNCGKYISLSNVSDCAYNIIMATEIIGLSHEETRVIANVIRYNTTPFAAYGSVGMDNQLTSEEYLLVAKLTAILRVANALDRSHKQKCQNAVITLKAEELVITASTEADLTLEKLTLADRAEFFEDVFLVHPVLHQKKR